MKKHHLRNDIKFARYGSLNPIKHKKYVKNKLNNKLPDAELWDKNIGYHSPPARYGIYAFVYPFIEQFLLSAPTYSGIYSTHPKFSYVKCKNGNKFIFDYNILYDKTNPDTVFNGFNLSALRDPSQTECFKKQFNKANKLPKDMFMADMCDKDTNNNDIHSYLVQQVKPKVFSYSGQIWHHLGDLLDSPGSIIERRGGWVKTDFLDYKLALHKALGQATVTNFRPYKYSWDFLEVFIEKV